MDFNVKFVPTFLCIVGIVLCFCNFMYIPLGITILSLGMYIEQSYTVTKSKHSKERKRYIMSCSMKLFIVSLIIDIIILIK